MRPPNPRQQIETAIADGDAAIEAADAVPFTPELMLLRAIASYLRALAVGQLPQR